MAGSNVFVVYSSADGKNVTLSPRQPTGHVMPLYDNTTEAVLLEGSGIANGVMTANILCKNCQKWPSGTLDVSSTSSSWVYAYKSGSAFDSDSVTQTITQHDISDVYTLDLSKAQGTNTGNPFVATTNTSSSSPSVVSAASSAGAPAAGSSDVNMDNMIRYAHAVIMGLVFLGIFPFAALMLRVLSFPNLVWVHGAFQVFGLVLALVAMGLGIHLAQDLKELFSNPHTILGVVVVALLVLQPFLGYTHHRAYKVYQSRTVWSYIHMYYGRVLILVGGANGILGFNLSGLTGKNIWIVVWVIVAALYLVIWGSTALAKRRQAKNGGSKNGRGRGNGVGGKMGKRDISPPIAMNNV
jgi:hypothetical protein